MKLREGTWSFDSRDLMRAQCSHCTELSVARELGVSGLKEVLEQFYVRPDNLPIRYGNKFEADLESELLANLGDLIQKPGSFDPKDTSDLMEQGVPVIYQGSLVGGSGQITFSGRPDFLLRSDYAFEFGMSGLTAKQVKDWQGGYAAWDAKLSKTAKPAYQVQVGCYVDVLEEMGLSSDSTHGLIQGNRQLSQFSGEVLTGLMVEKREEFISRVNTLLTRQPKSLADLGALICDASSYCDMCEYPALCQHTRHETNNLQLVAGISKHQIDSLKTVGITSVVDLGSFIGSTEKLSEEKIAQLSRQARLQQHTYDTGEHVFEIKDQEPLDLLPSQSVGDLFFDLEGFAFSNLEGGIEYLFGYLTIDGLQEFHYSWADSREAEKESFVKFVRFLLARLAEYPNLKVYHYANYELAALRRLSKRHKVMETEVEQLISGGVFIDLYNVVKASLVISQESYSIKKLENYYEFDRSADVKEAMGSMEYYDQYLSLVDSEPDQAEMLKRQVLNYNQDDCVSTLALCRWLRSL